MLYNKLCLTAFNPYKGMRVQLGTPAIINLRANRRPRCLHTLCHFILVLTPDIILVSSEGRGADASLCVPHLQGRVRGGRHYCVCVCACVCACVCMRACVCKRGGWGGGGGGGGGRGGGGRGEVGKDGKRNVLYEATLPHLPYESS